MELMLQQSSGFPSRRRDLHLLLPSLYLELNPSIPLLIWQRDTLIVIQRSLDENPLAFLINQNDSLLRRPIRARSRGKLCVSRR